MMKPIWLRPFFLAALLISLTQCKSEIIDKVGEAPPEQDHSVISLLGKTFHPAEPSQESLDNYSTAKSDFENDALNLDKAIWHGRRTAYLGRYQEAIEIYTKTMELHPEEPRLYRHRGHRYISMREYYKAIADLSKAATLIEGTEDRVEADGLPNKLNIPLSTLHGNIWYHLGLAHYLKYDFENARSAFEESLASGQNEDNIVSNTHWLYMINRRMGDIERAKESLELISDAMAIVENQSYYDLCRYYKGLIPRDSLLNDEGSPAGDALAYGLANWDFYNNR